MHWGSFNGPSKGQIKAIVPVGVYQTDPVMGPDSVFYIVADTNLYAFTLKGNQLWSAYIGKSIYGLNYSPPMITADGVILVGTIKGISAFRSDGTLIWETQLGGPVELKSCAIGLDGTIYVISKPGTLNAIDKSGNILWQHNAPAGEFNWGDASTISFAPNGDRIYVGGSTAEHSLFVLNTNGDIIRSDSLGGRQGGAISIDVDGNVYTYLGDDLVSVSQTGTERWRISGVGRNWNVIIDPNGNIAYLSNGKLNLVDNKGQKRWSVPVGQADFGTHIVCDAQGTIYIETSNDFANYDVKAINNSGSVLWTLSVPAHSKEGGPSLTKEGYLLFPHVGIPPPRGMYVIE